MGQIIAKYNHPAMGVLDRKVGVFRDAAPKIRDALMSEGVECIL